ncbi:uncharacterized protein [Anoplolepis gracilipes]|uniref:uncharacterized protein n=1 Tax=Anoplolepis gracilipes TaxID=354296 RepID=UPI003BA20F79
MTQLMTGHGCFSTYLHRIGKAPNTNCWHCDSVCDSQEHTLAECGAWIFERDTLREKIGTQITLENIVKAILVSKENWRAFEEFCQLVLRAKEDFEREREREAASSLTDSIA